MTSKLVLASDPNRQTWSAPRPGDLVMYPFPSGRMYRVASVFDNGDVALDEDLGVTA